MSAHSEIVRDYIELRNFLAQSHPQPNMKFDVEFIIQGNRLLAQSTVSKSIVEICGIQPHFWRLYTPHHGVRFEIFSTALISYINDHMPVRESSTQKAVLTYARQYKNNLNLKAGYEPKN